MLCYPIMFHYIHTMYLINQSASTFHVTKFTRLIYDNTLHSCMTTIISLHAIDPHENSNALLWFFSRLPHTSHSIFLLPSSKFQCLPVDRSCNNKWNHGGKLSWTRDICKLRGPSGVWSNQRHLSESGMGAVFFKIRWIWWLNYTSFCFAFLGWVR